MKFKNLQKEIIMVWTSALLLFETPAKQLLKAFTKTWKKAAGQPKSSWLSIILKDTSRYSEIKLPGLIEKPPNTWKDMF